MASQVIIYTRRGILIIENTQISGKVNIWSQLITGSQPAALVIIQACPKVAASARRAFDIGIERQPAEWTKMKSRPPLRSCAAFRYRLC